MVPAMRSGLVSMKPWEGVKYTLVKECVYIVTAIAAACNVAGSQITYVNT